MPNIRIHEQVAYIYANKYKEYLNKEFFLGVLAPDSPNLEGFAEKEERWTAHQRKKDLNKWLDKIINFYNTNKSNYNKYFIYGYLFHVITDIVFDEKYYLKVRDKIINDNNLVEESHNIMRNDMDNYGTTVKEYNIVINYLNEITEFYDILNIDKELLRKWKDKNCKQEEIKQSKYIDLELIKELELDVEEVLNKRVI